MTKAVWVEVQLAQQGQRIDNFLINYLKGVPKSRIYKAIRSGEVRVNGGRIKQTHRLSSGEQIRVPPIQCSEKKAFLPPSARWLDNFEDQILFQSADVLIVNKPPGMPVHAGTGIDRGLIENLRACPAFGDEWELVHRLDRDTSGLLVLARQGPALKDLQLLFREREVEKTYFLWVKGVWRGGPRVVDLPLLRETGGNGERIVVVNRTEGKPSRTRFEPLVVKSDKSLLIAYPETGRTHQIRVHAASIGHPIIGDKKYGYSNKNQIFKEPSSSRLFLHAASLCFRGKWSYLSICALPDQIWYKMREIAD
jgi:23S rRNA pseudouridine955/2504/2580 synthase